MGEFDTWAIVIFTGVVAAVEVVRFLRDRRAERQEEIRRKLELAAVILQWKQIDELSPYGSPAPAVKDVLELMSLLEFQTHDEESDLLALVRGLNNRALGEEVDRQAFKNSLSQVQLMFLRKFKVWIDQLAPRKWRKRAPRSVRRVS